MKQFQTPLTQDNAHTAGAAHASRRIFMRLLCLCGKLISRSLKKPTSSQYFFNLTRKHKKSA